MNSKKEHIRFAAIQMAIAELHTKGLTLADEQFAAKAILATRNFEALIEHLLHVEDMTSHVVAVMKEKTNKGPQKKAPPSK